MFSSSCPSCSAPWEVPAKWWGFDLRYDQNYQDYFRYLVSKRRRRKVRSPSKPWHGKGCAAASWENWRRSWAQISCKKCLRSFSWSQVGAHHATRRTAEPTKCSCEMNLLLTTGCACAAGKTELKSERKEMKKWGVII